MRSHIPPSLRLLAVLATSLALSQIPTSRPSPVAAANETVAACPSLTPPGDPSVPPPYVKITFVNECGEPVSLAVDIAATAADQERGLMEVSDLPPDQGELFAFQNLAGGSEVVVGFWMEDTLIPLSIAFIGANDEVHEIQDMQAESTNIHLPRAPYLYAVEANLGWFTRHEIIPGATVDLSPAVAQLGASTAP
ncbi:MAG TPA: DUF192 domain-containing protein [Dehalococcoidia bacterium]|nr:DUF192 domain-containing protein [Dehalococcoidia bacterium]